MGFEREQRVILTYHWAPGLALLEDEGCPGVRGLGIYQKNTQRKDVIVPHPWAGGSELLSRCHDCVP